ncbi:putative ribonuclease H-like domain-containing protein [Tanacetum coccineum]
MLLLIMMDKNLAFHQLPILAVPNSINTANTGVSTGNSKVNTASAETSTASFSDATAYAFLSSQPQGSQLVHEDLEQIHDDDLEEMDLKWNMALLSMRARSSNQRNRRRLLLMEVVLLVQANMALMAFTDSEVSNDKTCSKNCLQNYEALKKQYDDLLVKLDDTAFKAATYKRGLSILEAQVVKYKESEVLFSEEIALLKRSVGLEEFQQPEINWYGPRDSISKPTTVCDRESNNSKENTDDLLTQKPKSVTETSSVVPTLKVDKKWKEKLFNQANNVRLEEPKKARENTDAPIIEDWVSDDEEEVESIPKEEKKANVPIATEKESVKPVSPSRKSIRATTKLNEKGFCGLVDAQGHVGNICPPSVSKNLMEDLLLLVEEQMEEESMVKMKTSEIIKKLYQGNRKSVDKKVKIIEVDNGTEFKNHLCWKRSCREKGYKERYSGSKEHSTNGVAVRKNRNILRLARTMLAVLRVCKQPIGFMKPFGVCYNSSTLDKLGKFDGKSDEGFFVGYSLSSKAFRVYNIRTRKVQENLHVGFLENKPMLEGNGPKWLFDLDSLTQTMNYVPVVAGTFSNVSAGMQEGSESNISSQQDQDCIFMPIWKDASYFEDITPQSVDDVQLQDQDGNHDDCSLQDDGIDDHQVNTASPQVNTGSRELSTAVPEVNTATPEDLMGQIPTSEDTQVEDQEIELGNISPSYAVSSTPHTRIHKDHPIDHVIGDVQSSVQTRRMTTSYSELGFLGAIYEGKTHQDLHTCLFACFLSQEEPKRVSKALSDPAWVEAMQEELLRFKL